MTTHYTKAMMKSGKSAMFKATLRLKLALITSMWLSASSWAQSTDSAEYKTLLWKYHTETTNNKLVQKELRTIHEAKTATLIFIQPYLLDPPHNEPEFQQYGCKYVTNDAESISALEEILINAKTKASQKRVGGGFYMGIYLTFADNNILKLMFNEPAPSDKTMGGGIENPSQRQRIVSDEITQNLYRWAAKTGIKTRCDGLLRK